MSLRVVALFAALVLAVGAAVLAYVATIHPAQVGARIGFIVLALGSAAAWAAFLAAVTDHAARRRQAQQDVAALQRYARLEARLDRVQREVRQLRDDQALGAFDHVMHSRTKGARHLRSIGKD